jgi:hypothetical protein
VVVVTVVLAFVYCEFVSYFGTEYIIIITLPNMLAISSFFRPVAARHLPELKCDFMCVVPMLNALGCCKEPLQPKQYMKGSPLLTFAP